MTPARSTRTPTMHAPPPNFDAYYNAARPNLLALLEAYEPRRALEIGCGAAANLRLLKARVPACHTVGIERDDGAVRHALAHGAADEVHVGDILDGALPAIEGRRFDLLLLSHVLEHFDDPARVLQRALGWLEPEGRVLVALPNLRHYSVVYDLAVRGDFRYRADGILDRTHLRFFTRRSAERFLAAEGLQILRQAPDIVGRGSRLISGASFRLADEFAAFAYNFCLRRAPACAS